MNVTQTAGCHIRAPQWENTTDTVREFGVPEVNPVDTLYESAQNACSVRNIPRTHVAANIRPNTAGDLHNSCSPSTLKAMTGGPTQGDAASSVSRQLLKRRRLGASSHGLEIKICRLQNGYRKYLFITEKKISLMANKMSNVCQTKSYTFCLTISCASGLNVFANKTFHEVLVTSPSLCSLCPKHGWCAIPCNQNISRKQPERFELLPRL